jgi:hypothetical protein
VRKKDRNVLDLIPEKNCSWEEEADKTVTLLRPRFKTAFLRKVAMRFGRSEHFRIHLDEKGTGVWKWIDGERTVEEIGGKLEREKNETSQQAYERLAKFLLILQRNSFIRWKDE